MPAGPISDRREVSSRAAERETLQLVDYSNESEVAARSGGKAPHVNADVASGAGDSPEQPAAEGFHDESRLLLALREGDERAFETLVDCLNGALRRLARLYVNTAAEAEEVVQDTWVGVIRGLGTFEQRSSLQTWVCSILINRAKTRGRAEQRSIPFSSAWEDRWGEPAVDPSRFRPQDGRWVAPPGDFHELPEARLLASETIQVVENAISALPAAQREVMTLRDIEHWTAIEVCNALGVSEGNQRVLLHRARARVRTVLEGYFADEH